MKQII